MATDSDIHVGDVGTTFSVTLLKANGSADDVSWAQVIEFLFKKPDESIIEREGVFATDGTDGAVEYVTVADDLDQDGNWRIQVRLASDDTESPATLLHSEVDRFRVRENLA